MISPPTVLSFTCPEYGQANVHLSTSYELALAGANVHIASFASLASRVSSLQQLLARHVSRSGITSVGSVRFHECNGVTPYWNALERHGLNNAALTHPHGVSGALEYYPRLAFMGFPWSPEEHLTAIRRLKEIIAETKPDVVVVDPVFGPATDACELMGQKFMVLVPTSIKGVAGSFQPHLAALWKYPAGASGFSFPIEWWRLPLNVYLHIRLIMQMIMSKHVRQVLATRKSLGIKSGFFGGPPGVKCISPALPEIDWPLAVIPEHIIPCGPIVIPFEPLEEKDPSMMKWLDNGPTVMVNLGSHVVSDAHVAKEMAGAFRILLDYYVGKGVSKIHVLWKVRASGDIEKAIHDIIGKEIKEGTVKVVSWLEADPVSIMQHPNVVCTVHHGGANSFYEGIWSGVPQVILPVWIDTYEYAACAEYLNVGIFANKSCSPGVRAEEFGKALVRVTGNTEEAGKFRSAAKHLKEICRAKGNGRELASIAILNEARTTK